MSQSGCKQTQSAFALGQTDAAFDLHPLTNVGVVLLFVGLPYLFSTSAQSYPDFGQDTNSATTRANKITHVVMVKDADTIVHARGTAYGVRTDSIDIYGEKIVAVTRWHENVVDTLTTTNAAASGQVANAFCSGNSVNLRGGAGTDYAILAILNRNHPMVTVTGSSNWALVTTIKNGKAYTGYMSTKYIEILPEG